MFFAAMMTLWNSPASAEYCSVQAEGKARSCTFRVDRIPNNSQIVISYTQQGWSMMVVVFLDEFAIIEGPAKLKIHKGETFTMEHVKTRRDLTPRGRMMEAAIYRANEELLRAMGQSGGKIRIYLAASEGEDPEIEVEVAASLFSDIDTYIEETKTELGVLFKEE